MSEVFKNLDVYRMSQYTSKLQNVKLIKVEKMNYRD